MRFIDFLTISVTTGNAVHFDFGLADGVLLAAGRDHSTHFTGRPFTGQISRLHDDPRHAIHHGYRLRP